MFKVVKTAQPSALPPVRDALALCFGRQPRAAAYVGALQRLAIEDRGGAVDAAEVASAAVQSGSLQSGALQVLTMWALKCAYSLMDSHCKSGLNRVCPLAHTDASGRREVQ